MSTEDKTGAAVSDQDIDDALDAVTASLVKIATLPPQLAVNLPNIRRCLQQFKTSRAAMKLLSGG